MYRWCQTLENPNPVLSCFIIKLNTWHARAVVRLQTRRWKRRKDCRPISFSLLISHVERNSARLDFEGTPVAKLRCCPVASCFVSAYFSQTLWQHSEPRFENHEMCRILHREGLEHNSIFIENNDDDNNTPVEILSLSIVVPPMRQVLPGPTVNDEHGGFLKSTRGRVILFLIPAGIN